MLNDLERSEWSIDNGASVGIDISVDWRKVTVDSLVVANQNRIRSSCHQADSSDDESAEMHLVLKLKSKKEDLGAVKPFGL